MKKNVEKKLQKNFVIRRFIQRLYGKVYGATEKQMPFIGISVFVQLRPPFEPDIIKNRAQKSAKMLQHSLRGEHVLWVTALTSYVDATQITGKMQNEMAWLHFRNFCPCPSEKEQGPHPPQEDSGQILLWGSFVPKRGTNIYHCPVQLLWDTYIHCAITENFVMTGHAVLYVSPWKKQIQIFLHLQDWT